MASTLFKGGMVIDGRGEPAFPGHVLIEGGRISAVARQGEGVPPADEVIDIQGKAVAPGFIDMHSHLDWALPQNDHPWLLRCMVEQGVTTLVAGNCGISPAPIMEGREGLLQSFASINLTRPLDITWSSMAEFLDHLEETGPLVNVAELVGHASIRFAATRVKRGPMAPEDLERCLDLTRQSLDQGACGLSFGLGYDPGMYSLLSELEAFSRAAAEAGKPVTVHLKALSWLSPCYPLTTLRSHNLKALEEMIGVAERSGAALQLSHFIFVGRNSWRTAPEGIAMVERARERGVDVMIDAFPYTCGNTTINVPIPYWFLAKIPKSYRSRRDRAIMKMEMELGFRLVGFIYKDFQVMDAAVPGWEDLAGVRVSEIAEMWNTTPFDTWLDLSEKSRGAATVLFHAYSGEPGRESVIESVLSHPQCLFETDAVVKDRGYPNPAALGTFPRILGEFVRERKLMRIEDAVRRMTSASAARFGLSDRGELAPGKAADLVVFDPETVSDNFAGGKEPAGRPNGIDMVFINGELTVRDGSYLEGVRPGRVLKA